MPRKITFNVPTKSGNRTEQGYKVHLMLGSERHTFALQFEGKRPSKLVHFASGYVVRDLAPLALTQYVSNPYAYDDTYKGWRKRAQYTLDDLVRTHGADKLLAKFASVPTINA